MTDLTKLSKEQLDVADQMLTMFERAKLPLTEDKLNYGFKVADEAKRQGLNSQFVLPLVMAESKFDPNAVSPTGAFGLMQLQPSTSKSLKVDPKDIDQNISGGVSLIKELISNPQIGNDPYKILIGYNTSTETRNKYFESGDLKALPKETLDYMENASTYFGGDLPSPIIAKTETVKSSDDRIGSTETNPVSATQMSGFGGGLGILGGTAAATLQAKKDVAEQGAELIDAFKNRNQPTTTNVVKGNPNVVAESTLTPSEAQHQRAIQGTTEENVSGRARQTTYNERTKTIAEQAKQKAQQIANLKKLGIVTGEGADLSKYGHVASTPSGVLTTANAVEDLATSTANATKALAPVAQESSPLWNYAKHLLSYPLKGALTGAQVVGGATDVYNRAHSGHTGEAITSAIGNTMGAVAPYLEYGATKIAPRLAPLMGGAVAPLAGIAGVATPLYLSASDRLRHLQKHPEDYQLPEVVNGMRFGPSGEPYRD
jgi:hypothetical protein